LESRHSDVSNVAINDSDCGLKTNRDTFRDNVSRFLGFSCITMGIHPYLSGLQTMKTIKDMPKHSRPREKLREKGVSALTDEELVTAILGMGTAGLDVRTIARQVASLIREHKGTLTLDHLQAVPGMGLAKAAQVLSAFELARRCLLKDSVKITVAQDVLPLVADIAGRQQEHFVCISLNGANEVIEKRVVTIGLLDKSPVQPREVFADAIADRAAALIFAHNHPSGDLQPSEADRHTHDQLSKAAEILGLRVLDHRDKERPLQFSRKRIDSMKASTKIVLGKPSVTADTALRLARFLEPPLNSRLTASPLTDTLAPRLSRLA
jgi:DNA repair protein RadC